jgi:hypothetical protein
MLATAYSILDHQLSEPEKQTWREGMGKAADYLTIVMGIDFASINYLATTAAALAQMERILPDPRRRDKARRLARYVVGRMNADGFVDGEGARVSGVKHGVDVGYEMDMTLGRPLERVDDLREQDGGRSSGSLLAARGRRAPLPHGRIPEPGVPAEHGSQGPRRLRTALFRPLR